MATENTQDADGPRLAITDDDRSAFIIVVTATLAAWTVVVLTIRVASKLSARITVGLEAVAVILSSVSRSAWSRKMHRLTDLETGARNWLFHCNFRRREIWPWEVGRYRE